MSVPSPFRAGFGKVPPTMAGRERILGAFTSAIRVGSWSVERAVLPRGFRGVGKTVTLESLRRIAEDAGWVTVDDSASVGFFDRMLQKLRLEIDRRAPTPAVRLKALGIATLGSFELDRPAAPRAAPTLERLVEELAELVEPNGGILFALDEVSTSTIDEFRAFVGALQRSISRDREIALVAAGLHGDIAEILRDGSSTFLRRAHQENLDLLDFDATRLAIRAPILDHGRTISDAAVDYAARASQGYPFLTQLIGDLAWKANPDLLEVTTAAVRSASRKSKRRIGSHIHEPSLAALAALDRTVLAAMAQDERASNVSDLRERVGDISKQHLNNVRNRLLDAGVVFSPRRGQLDFALPYLRDYLREHTVTDAMGATSAEIAAAREKFPPPPADL